METSTANSKIIIIDDELTILKLLRRILADEPSYSLTSISDATQGLQILTEERFDLISLDYRMPDISGAEIIQRIRSSNGVNKKTPIIIFTGYIEEAKSIMPSDLEDVYFIEKPINNKQYLRQIKLILEGKKHDMNEASPSVKKMA